MLNRKPVLQWACHKLEGDWVMVGVDADLSGRGQCKMLGYRMAVHRYCSDAELRIVIAQMQSVVMAGRANGGRDWLCEVSWFPMGTEV